MAPLRLIALLVLVGCYDVPQPRCGFQCGPPASIGGLGTCPAGYSCLADRCLLDADPPSSCPDIDDPMVGDRTAPRVTARAPMMGEIDVALDTVVLVTFDEAVFDVTEATFGVSTDTGFVMGEVTIASPGRAFRFTPDRDLVVNKVYEVVLGSAIQDTSGNRLVETRWTFSTIEDRTGPMILASTPADGATNVPVIGDLSVSFDEPVMGVDMSSVRLEQNGAVIPTALSMPLSHVVNLVTDPLVGETTYTIVLTDQITDLPGNPITPTTISFTTRETTPPAIVNRVPAPDATSVDIDTTIAITFSEQVDAPSIDLLISGVSVDAEYTDELHGDGTYTFTITPLAALAPDAVYTVRIGMVRDLVNNAATFPDYTFTTAP